MIALVHSKSNRPGTGIQRLKVWVLTVVVALVVLWQLSWLTDDSTSFGVGSAMSGGAGSATDMSLRARQPSAAQHQLINARQLVPFTKPDINGPEVHDIVFSGVPKAVARVWAHPHNKDRNFDFWGAVGTFDGNAAPNSGVYNPYTEVFDALYCTVAPIGGWGSDYFRSLMQMVTQPNSVYICVGGWIGATTLYAATLPAQPTVWSFEADPVAFAEVCRFCCCARCPRP